MSSNPIIGTLEIHSAKRLENVLNSNNVPFINFPMIETHSLQLSEEIKTVFDQIETYDWIIFTSRNGIKSFCELWKKYKKRQFTKNPKNKIATIGKSSASLLAEQNVKADFINPGSTSGEFIHHIDKDEIIQNTDKVLLVLGNLAPDILYSKIKEITPSAHRIDVYTTTYKTDIDSNIYKLIKKDQYSLLLFTSPSAFDNFMRHYPKDLNAELRVAAIGKTTAKFIRHRNKNAKIEFIPSKAEFETLGKELANFIKKK